MSSAVFNIHPVGQASITCGYIGSDSISSNYIVNLPIDWREEERMEVLYGDRISNQIKGFNYGTATVTIIIAVGGATVAEVAANARTLERAFSNANGGFIEYKPVDYPDTVLHTYYHYLPAPPPRLIRGKAQTADDNVYGFGLEFQVPIQAWATSDPDNPATLLTDEAIENADDGTRDNFVIIPSNDIKGDIFFPKIKLEGNYGTTEFERKILVYKRGMRPGANTNLDWFEMEDVTDTDTADATRSGGAYANISLATLFSSPVNNLGWDSTYAGTITPIIAARCQDGTTEWQVTLTFAKGDNDQDEQASQLFVNVNNDDWTVYHQFPEIRFPNFRPQHHITDDSTPSFVDYTKYFRWDITVVRISGSGNLHIDWLCLAKASDFICLLEAGFGATGITHSGADYLEIDAMSGGIYHIDDSTNPGTHMIGWSSKGMPISDLLFYKGEDSRIRFIYYGDPPTYPYNPAFTSLITVTGLHGTIYPFDVA